jgi:hypothetical protein
MAVAADTVYFAILADRHTSSPTGIARRRLDAGEAIEETWTRATRWTPNKVVTRFYLKPDPDDEVAMITESEALALLEWFQQRDGSPPFPGGPLVNAWEIIFIGSTAARELLTRLRLDQHGTVPFSGGLALGLRVLHTGTFGRAALTLHQLLRDAWAVSIEQFGTAPSPTLVEQVRAEVLAAIVDLPVSVVREKYPSASIGRWNEPRGWSSAAHYGLVLQITARGALTGEAISELRAQLHCVDDRDVDSDTDHGRRRGSTRHVDNGRYRAVLRFEAMDADRWLFLLVVRDRRWFTEADLRRWRESLHAAMSEAGLIVESTWQSGGVAPSV